MKTIRLFIVDDHKVLREGIISLLFEDEFDFVGEASSGPEAIEMISTLSQLPDVILMDITLQGMTGIECTRELMKQYHGEIKILALSMVRTASTVRKMLQAGAKGYILKDGDKQELIEAIRAVSKGETYFSEAIKDQVMSELTKTEKEPQRLGIDLSKREIEILDMIVKDLTNQEIANLLYISPRTVESHKQNLLAKTGVKSLAGLVVFAVRNNLVDI